MKLAQVILAILLATLDVVPAAAFVPAPPRAATFSCCCRGVCHCKGHHHAARVRPSGCVLDCPDCAGGSGVSANLPSVVPYEIPVASAVDAVRPIAGVAPGAFVRPESPPVRFAEPPPRLPA